MHGSDAGTNQVRPFLGVMLAGLITAGLASTALGAAAPANASCASFSGINIGSGCTSKLFGIAIAFGAGATAEAGGAFSTSFAIGKGADAYTGGALDLAVAAGPDSLAQVLGGSLNIAVAAGATGGADYAQADAGWSKADFSNVAVTLGNSSYAYAGGPTETKLGAGNLAVNFGTGNDVESIGFLNGALGVGGRQPYINNLVVSAGVLNSATSIGGNLNTVSAGTSSSSVGNSAFSVFGSGNSVTAGPGPLALAGSLFQKDTTVTKVKPGVNINGFKVPNTAASANAPKAAASRRGAGNAASPAAAVRGKGSGRD